MAYDDALFQLGMDLARGSSTAQKEDHAHRAQVAHQDDPKDDETERQSARLSGKHLNIDLFGAQRLDDLDHVEATLRRCVDVSGGKLRLIHFYPFTATGGVSAIVVLPQSHISFYGLPETGTAALDVFVGDGLEPDVLVGVLQNAFDAKGVAVKEFCRPAIDDDFSGRRPVHQSRDDNVRTAA